MEECEAEDQRDRSRYGTPENGRIPELRNSIALSCAIENAGMGRSGISLGRTNRQGATAEFDPKLTFAPEFRADQTVEDPTLGSGAKMVHDPAQCCYNSIR